HRYVSRFLLPQKS
ncbi:argininosuccinate synthase, partial [Vibrio parahaemolyticus VPTS-2010_2]